MWTFEVDGDDSWDTAERLLRLLVGYHVIFRDEKDEPITSVVEIVAFNAFGIFVWPIDENGNRRKQVEADFITTTPGSAYPHFVKLTIQ